MKKELFMRAISLMLAAILCMGLLAPASTAVPAEGTTRLEFTQVDNGAVSAPITPAEFTQAEDASPYQATDVVRVSILLDGKSTLEAGYSTLGIAENASAMSYRRNLARRQEAMVDAISAEALEGEPLDVVWNLTLAANLVSANVPYGKIQAIRELAGIRDVILETCYAPCVVDREEADGPNMATSAYMIGSHHAWAAGYTGAGSRVAVIDTGIDTDHQSFDAAAFEYALELQNAQPDLLDADEIRQKLSKLNIASLGYPAKELYVSSKIAFAFNYVDENLDITHDHDHQGEHGSHVEGIAAANAYIPNGDGTFTPALEAVKTQGVAPDAQIIAMKVFGTGGGAYDSDYMAAIEDAIILEADAINLSLGSAMAGTSRHSNAAYQTILDNVVNSDTVLVISAGNAGGWADQTYGGYLYDDGVNLDTLGSPGSYTNSLAIASVDNAGFTGTYFQVGQRMFSYTETTGYSNEPLATIPGEYDYIFIDGFGTEEDFAALNGALEGKIAFCSRGSTSFYQKAEAAVKYGAVATIVYNNQPGSINMDLSDYTQSQPCVSILQSDGARIRSVSEPVTNDGGQELYRTGTMQIVAEVDSAIYDLEYYNMSSFSSWGVPGTLELKPELTAPGGSIYSVNGAVAGGTSYEVMSGTSMAAPQVAGMAALVAQYIRQAGLDEKTGLNFRALSQSLMMSTAVPLREEASRGQYWSVLKQGAGLADVAKAISAQSYVLMKEDATASYADGKVKAELGDDPDRTGIYHFSFTLHNLTDREQQFVLSADLFTQDLLADEEGTSYMDTCTAMLQGDVRWSVDGQTLTPTEDLINMDFNGDQLVNTGDVQALLDYVVGERTEIANEPNADLDGDGAVTTYDAYSLLKGLNSGLMTLPADGQVEVQVELSLTEAQKTNLDESYPAGAYVEGYFYARQLPTAEGVEGTIHSIPVLGFYGNWTDGSMFDVGSYVAYQSGEEDRVPYLASATGNGAFFANSLAIRYAGQPRKQYHFGGNPIVTDETYMPERNAINGENGDQISSWNFALIRNAAASRFTVTHAGEIIHEMNTGSLTAAFYHVNQSAWQNTGYSLKPNYTPSGLEEGDQIELALTMAPELYVDAAGHVDWDALGEGASMEMPMVIDNTAPTLEDVSLSLTGDSLQVTARDNQYVAGVVLYNAAGTQVLTEAGAKQEAKPGETLTYTLDMHQVEGERLLLQVYDYAMNATTYKIKLGGAATVDTKFMAFYLLPNDDWYWDNAGWIGFDEAVKGDVTALAGADYIFTAAEFIGDHLYAMDDNGQLYCFGGGDLTAAPVPLGEPVVQENPDEGMINKVIFTDMTYDETSGKLYAVYSLYWMWGGWKYISHIAEVDPRTGQITDLTPEKTIGITDTEGKSLQVYGLTDDGAGNLYALAEDPQSHCLELYKTATAEEGFGNRFELVFDTGYTWVSSRMTVNSDRDNPLHFVPMVWEDGNLYFFTEHDAPPAYETVEHVLVKINLEAKTAETVGHFDEEAFPNVSCLMLNRNGLHVSLDATSLEMLVGSTEKLTATVTPWEADGSVTWTTSDETVATVNDRGVVTAHSFGNCTITATAVADPTQSAACEVAVKIIDVTLKGALQDQDGNPQLFTWNLETDETWTAGPALPSDLAAVAYSVPNQALYVQNRDSVMFRIDPVTGEKLDASAGVSAFGAAMQDMAMLEVFATADSPLAMGVYRAYLLGPNDPLANTFDSGWNLTGVLNQYTGATKFVAITSGGMGTNDKGTACDFLFALDDTGSVWTFWYDGSGSISYNFYSSTLTGLDYPTESGAQNSSLVLSEDGSTLFFSYFTGTTNEIYVLQLMQSSNQEYYFRARSVGDMGDGVWPAALYEACANGAANGIPAVSLSTQKPTATLQAEMLAPEQSMAAGMLHAYPGTAERQSKPWVSTDSKTVTLALTAKDAQGVDTDSTNGLLTVEYDGEIMTLTDVQVAASYCSIAQAEGVVKLAYAGLDPIEAGRAVATLTFARKDEMSTTITVSNQEVNDTRPAYREQMEIGPHKSHCPSAAFEDLDVNAWYHEATDFTIARGYMNGVSATGFAPGSSLTRAQAVTVLYRMEGEPETTAENPFTDVAANKYYTEAVIWAAENQIVKGMDATHYAPNTAVTREQLVTILARYAAFKGADVSAEADPDFPDVGQVSHYAMSAMAWAVERGLICGIDGMLSPKGTASRAQFATVIMRFCEKILGEPGF